MSTALLHRKRSSDPAVYSTSGGRLSISEEYTYFVQATSTSDGAASVLSTSGLPTPELTVSSLGVPCVELSCERSAQSNLIWLVKAKFEGQSNQQQDPNNVSNDPTTWIPIWSAGVEYVERPKVVDSLGVPYKNSAGQWLSEGRMKRVPVLVFEFVQYEASNISRQTIARRMAKVNNAAFKTFGIRQLFIEIKKVTYGKFYGYDAVEIAYKLMHQEGVAGSYYKEWSAATSSFVQATTYSGWRDLRLDVGTAYWDGAALKPVVDEYGNRFEGNLDGSGARVTGNSPPAVLGFDEFYPISFSFLR